MTNFPEILKREILKGLPGTEVQLRMAPPDMHLMNFPKAPGPRTRIAAVLVLLYEQKGDLSTVFIQRPDYEGVHGGQISFPGGMKESSDHDLVQTALREANEEVGVDISRISVIGTLTPLFIPVSDILVTPVAGWIDEKPMYNLQTEEVVFLIEGSVENFLDPSLVRIKVLEIRGRMRRIKYFDYNGYVIWGATAMILNELLEIIRRTGIL
ncbi:MAG: CoA pyrophosphatase [Bacteroidota bacterium]|nr:CoA pyrophosphatase [Bacteroidota bacterium]